MTDPLDHRLRLLTDPAFLGHDTGPGHPERPARIAALLEHLNAQPRFRALEQLPFVAAPNAAIDRVHSLGHRSRLEALAEGATRAERLYADPDTVIAPDSLNLARQAAGAVLEAVRFSLAAPNHRAFCAVRPPGHHAEHDQAMGFCLYNSIATGAASTLAEGRIERLAILDFDVHHGNGTFDIFKDDPRVLVCSSHQHPFYPQRQLDLDRPHLLRTPLAAHTEGSTFRQAIERDWLPALNSHRPQLILISAGFDAHEADPLAQLRLSVDDFRWITELIVDVAKRYGEGRIVSVLEGGYDLDALCASVTAHLEALGGG